MLPPAPGLTAVFGHSVPKHGRSPSENEDSFAADAVTGRFAISDGASTAARPEVWSRILTHAYVAEQLDPLEPAELPTLRQRWREEVVRPGLPWFAQEKLARGGAATFVGLSVSAMAFEVFAVGDSCLLHLRDDELLLACPLTDAAEFSRFPPLISTLDEVPPPEIWSGGGEHAPGDLLVLATDAMAKYLLDDPDRLRLLRVEGESAESFGAFVSEHRSRGLDNDDTTICVVRT